MSSEWDPMFAQWLRVLRPGPSGCPVLVCYPHAGASANAYAGLAREFVPGFEVVAVQYPGRQDRHREQLVDDISAMAKAVVAALHPVLHRPIALFGHSMGALLAFETARILEAEPRRIIDHMFISGRRAPIIQKQEHNQTLSDAMLVSELQRAGGTPASWLSDPELLSMVLPVIRNDYRAVANYHYVPGDSVVVDSTILVGDTDPYTTVSEAGMWEHLLEGESKLRIFSGGHFFVETNKAEVAQVISNRMHLVGHCVTA